MGQTDLKPTAQGQVESSINDTINFIMAKVAAGEIDAATATELIAAARKDYESNVPVTTSAQQAVQPQQTANPYQADPQTAYAVPEMEPEQTPIDYGQFATSTNYPHTYDVEDSSDVDMDALSGIASDVFDKQPRKKLSRKERKARAKEMKKLQKESNAKLKANAKSNKSIQKQLKDRDKELSKKNEFHLLFGFSSGLGNLSISLSIQFVDLFKQFRLLFGSGIEFLPLLFKGNTDCLFLPLLVGFLGLCRPFLQYLDLSSNLGFLGSQFRHLSILLFQLVSELGFRLGCVPVCKLFNGCDLFLLLSHLLLELTKRHLSSFTFLCKSRTLVFRKVSSRSQRELSFFQKGRRRLSPTSFRSTSVR